MNPILETCILLAAAVRDDPLLLLANTVAWLDPMWKCDQAELDDTDGGLEIALAVTRMAFPEIYAGAVEHIRAGASLAILDGFICKEISRRGIPLDHLEALSFGIPLTGVGIVLDDPETYLQQPELLPIVALFGIDPEANAYQVEVPAAAYTAGRLITTSLKEQSDERWQQIGWTLAWVFGCSGNSLVDLDDESLMEIQPLSWDADDVAFAVDLIEEANGIMQAVHAGLTWLRVSPDALTLLKRNVKHVFTKLKSTTGAKRDELRLRLAWSPLGECPN